MFIYIAFHIHTHTFLNDRKVQGTAMKKLIRLCDVKVTLRVAPQVLDGEIHAAGDLLKLIS